MVVVLLLVSLGLTGCKSSGTSTEESSSSASIVLSAQFSENVSENGRASALDAVISTIKDRLDAYGVAHSVVEREGGDRILVKVKGVSSVETIEDLAQQTGYLEFREVEMNGSSVATLSDYLSDNRTSYYDSEVPGSRLFYASGSIDYLSGGQNPVAILTIADDGKQSYIDKDGNSLDKTTLTGSAAMSWRPALGTADGRQVPLTGAYLSRASAATSTSQTTGANEWAVAIDWNSDGWEIFNSIAARLYGKTAPQNELGIVLDDRLISSPTVQAPSYTTAEIRGNFDAVV